MTSSRHLQIMVIDTAGLDYGMVVKKVLSSKKLAWSHVKVRSTAYGDVFTLDHKWGPVGCRMQIVTTSAKYLDDPAMKVKMASCDAFMLVYSVEVPGSFDTVVAVRKTIQTERPCGLHVPVFVVGNNVEACEGKLPWTPNTEALEIVTWEWERNYMYREICMTNIAQLRNLIRDVAQEYAFDHKARFSTLVHQNEKLFSISKLFQCVVGS